MKYPGILLMALCMAVCSYAQENTTQNAVDTLAGNRIPMRGFCIGAPPANDVDRFVKFINEELAPRKVNVMVLRIDYNYAYETHPELRDKNPLSKTAVQLMVAACRKNNIRLIPQINLLGHQSWAGKTGKLLAVYPEFDETPQVKMPEKYAWPNADSLYCKSYCPLHPGVHKIVFELVDEVCDVFETNAFHAGMDEVFYLGHEQCPRCHGKDKAILFANEVTTIRDHLAKKQRQLWIWGDRLLDGKTTGLGMWEASYNNTWPAVDLVPKDIMVCDWHYERADKTPVYFAMKGLDVITCPWRNPAIAVVQAQDMSDFPKQSTQEMKPHFKGMMQTVWSGAGAFLDGFYGNKKDEKGGDNTPWNCFKALYSKIDSLQ